MNLKSFDNKCIRLTTVWGEVFEGIATYCGREYVVHEYGYNDEALHMIPILFCKHDIADIVSLEEVDSPFGHFTGKYGLLEKKCLEWGTDMMEEVFDSEDDVQILRLLACMNDDFRSLMDRAVPGMAPWRSGGSNPESGEEDSERGPVYLGELEKMLQTLVRYNENDEVVKEAKEFLVRLSLR